MICRVDRTAGAKYDCVHVMSHFVGNCIDMGYFSRPDCMGFVSFQCAMWIRCVEIVYFVLRTFDLQSS